MKNLIFLPRLLGVFFSLKCRYTIFSSYFGKTLSLFFTKIYILFRIPLNKGKTAASGRLEAASGKIVFLQFCNVFQIITLLLISY